MASPEKGLFRGKYGSKVRRCLVQNALVLLVLFGVIAGFGIGFGLRQTDINDDVILWTGLFGEIFVRMLKVTILPVIVCSIIHGTASLDPKSHGRISLLTVGFMVLANAVGPLVGIISYYIIRSGEGVHFLQNGELSKSKPPVQTQDMFVDFIRNVVPDNVVTACFEKTQTYYKEVESDGSNITTSSRYVGQASGTNILGILFLSTIIGMAASKMGEKGEIIVSFFEAFSDIFIFILKWFTWFTPVGVASLIAVSVASVESLEETFRSLGLLIAAFLIGIALQQVIIFPVFVIVVHRLNPFRFYLNSARAWMTVFAPPSSAVGIPEVLRLTEEVYHVDKRVSRFVVPFGASVCRIGSAHFICLASLFLAGIQGVFLNFIQVMVICLLCTFSALAVPSVPSGSLVLIMVLLTSVNVDADAIGILFTLEWFTDRLRTTCNTIGNILCTLTVNKLCKEGLAALDNSKRKPEEHLLNEISGCDCEEMEHC